MCVCARGADSLGLGAQVCFVLELITQLPKTFFLDLVSSMKMVAQWLELQGVEIGTLVQ